MATRRRIDPIEGLAALRATLENGVTTPGDDPGAERQSLATAVRFGLEELASNAPGRSVEVRVPPHGATQCIEGGTHRRGTPPAVIEMNGDTFVALAVGRLTWAEALASGRVRASGEHADLSAYLPLVIARDLQ